MSIILFYLLVGFSSYWFIAPMDGITLSDSPKWAATLAVGIWSFIWLPVLLYKIGTK